MAREYKKVGKVWVQYDGRHPLRLYSATPRVGAAMLRLAGLCGSDLVSTEVRRVKRVPKGVPLAAPVYTTPIYEVNIRSCR